MTKEDFDKMTERMLASAKDIREKKGPNYTIGDTDVLKNFKRIGSSLGIDAMIPWAVFMEKHFSAIIAYAKDKTIPQSEPIEGRFADMFNYLFLGYGLIEDARKEIITK